MLAPKWSCLTPNPNDECRVDYASNKPRVLLSILVFLNGAVDAAAWYLLQNKISKTIHVEMNDKNNRSSLISEHHTIDEYDELNCSNNSGGSGSNTTGNSSKETEGDSTTQKEPEQNVSNALRGEIISYMTARLARSIYNTAKETYDALNGDSMLLIEDYDIDFTFNNNGADGEEYEFNDDEKMNKGASANKSTSNEKLNILNCEESAPTRAQYPSHMDHAPKTHKGVINEMYIQLPTQHFLSMKVPMVTSSISNPSNCINGNNNNISVQNIYELKHHQSMASSNTNNNKQRLKSIEDEQSIGNNIEEHLLNSLDVKKGHLHNTQEEEEEEELEMQIYESNCSDVEMSVTRKRQKSGRI